MKIRLACGIPPGGGYLTQVQIEGPGSGMKESDAVAFVRARCGQVTIVEFDLPDPLTFPEPQVIQATVDKSSSPVPTSS